MAEEANNPSEQPVKRRPGRPRKNPLPVEVTPDVVAAETVAAEAVANEKLAEKSEPEDERIGIEVHPLASHIGYDDGRQYRCEGGLIVERLA